jgi:hypothetical protein
MKIIGGYTMTIKEIKKTIEAYNSLKIEAPKKIKVGIKFFSVTDWMTIEEIKTYLGNEFDNLNLKSAMSVINSTDFEIGKATMIEYDFTNWNYEITKESFVMFIDVTSL